MKIRITPNATSAQIETELKKLGTRRVFNAKKYAGVMTWGQDALEFQQELRGESRV